jgi:hypothetical protein
MLLKQIVRDRDCDVNINSYGITPLGDRQETFSSKSNLADVLFSLEIQIKLP